MSAVLASLCCAISSLLLLSGSIAFGVLYNRLPPFAVDGVLQSVDQCTFHCFGYGVGPSGCLYHAAVTLSWHYENTSFSVSNFSVPDNKCAKCCYAGINSTVQVAIDPANPGVAKDFWFGTEVPPNPVYFVLSLFSAVAAIGCCVCSCVTIKHGSEHGKRSKQGRYTKI